VEDRKRRIYEAQRAGLRNRMRDQWHIAETTADALIAAWESQAAIRSLSVDEATYWSDGEAWIRSRATAAREDAGGEA
jgi:hypothetical protein